MDTQENIINADLEYINTQLEIINSRNHFIETQKKQLETLAVNLTNKEKELIEKEIEIAKEKDKVGSQLLEVMNKNVENSINSIEVRNSYLEKLNQEIEATKERMLKNTEKEIETIRARKLKEAQKEFESKKTELLEHLKFLENEKRTGVEEIISKLEIKKSDIENEINFKQKEIADMFKALGERETSLKSKEDALKQKEKELAATAEEIEEKNDDYNWNINELKEKKKRFDNKVNEEIEKRLEYIKTEYVENKAMMEEKLEAYKKKLDHYVTIELMGGNRSKEELISEIKIQNETIKELEKRVSKYNEVELTALENKSRAYDELLEKYKSESRELSELRLKEARYEISVIELEQQRDKEEILKRRVEVIKEQILAYEKEVERLKTLQEKPKELEARIESIIQPYLEFKELMDEEDIDEIEWLEDIYEKCLESGIKFNKRLLWAFHTSLKTSEWSPLTILAGVSGTGKSELPRLYSRFGGMHYIPLAVQPDWDSPQSIFGYFNSIDNRFNATPLLRSIVQCKTLEKGESVDGNISDKMLLVLLDEMNLAHVELYFSELLSKLETRRGEKNSVNIEIDLGAGADKYPVELSKNILWTGTMNEDETTKSLSDKVIDRGSIINFPRPTNFERRLKVQLAAESPMLSRRNWDKWLDNKVTFDKEIDKYKECLEEINMELEHVGRALGHRVWQSIENYISNHPLVIKSKNENNGQDLDNCMRVAFEEALVYKVMTKLRGIENSGTAKKCLESIEKKLSELVSEKLIEDFNTAKKSAYGVFIWKSAKYLEDSYEE